MRHALVSLIAAASLATPALAQEATPAVPAVPTDAPAAPAQPALPEANPATPTVPAVQTPPAAEAAPAVVEAPPAPPPAPTDPVTIRTISLVETLCKPLVSGGDAAALTKSLGFKKKRDLYVLAQAKPTTFTLQPSGSNKNVCTIEIDHPIGGDKDITVGLHNWAIAQGFKLERNDEFTTDLKRHTRSWERRTDGKYEALVMVTSFNPDGSAVGKNADRTTVMYTVQ